MEPTHLSPLQKDLFSALQEKSAQDVVWLPVGSIFPLASSFLLASGTSGRHLQTLGEAVKQACRAHGVQPHIQGRNQQEDTSWIVVDVGTTFVHLFLPEARQYYQLESMWRDALARLKAPLSDGEKPLSAEGEAP